MDFIKTIKNPTKMKILYTAEKLFKERGYNNISVTDICNASDLARNTFYYYFKNKDEILDYYLIISSDIVNQNLPSILKLPSYYEKFWRMYELICQRVLDAGPDIIGQVFKRNIDKNIFLFDFDNFAFYDLFLTLIIEGQKAKEILNPMPAKNLMNNFMYLADGLALVWCTLKGNLDYIEENQKMIETLFIINGTAPVNQTE